MSNNARQNQNKRQLQHSHKHKQPSKTKREVIEISDSAGELTSPQYSSDSETTITERKQIRQVRRKTCNERHHLKKTGEQFKHVRAEVGDIISRYPRCTDVYTYGGFELVSKAEYDHTFTVLQHVLNQFSPSVRNYIMESRVNKDRATSSSTYILTTNS